MPRSSATRASGDPASRSSVRTVSASSVRVQGGRTSMSGRTARTLRRKESSIGAKNPGSQHGHGEPPAQAHQPAEPAHERGHVVGEEHAEGADDDVEALPARVEPGHVRHPQLHLREAARPPRRGPRPAWARRSRRRAPGPSARRPPRPASSPPRCRRRRRGRSARGAAPAARPSAVRRRPRSRGPRRRSRAPPSRRWPGRRIRRARGRRDRRSWRHRPPRSGASASVRRDVRTIRTDAAPAPVAGAPYSQAAAGAPGRGRVRLGPAGDRSGHRGPRERRRARADRARPAARGRDPRRGGGGPGATSSRPPSTSRTCRRTSPR